MADGSTLLNVSNNVVPMYVAMAMGWLTAYKNLIPIPGYEGLQTFLVLFCIPILTASVTCNTNLYEFNAIIIVAVLVHAAVGFALSLATAVILNRIPYFKHPTRRNPTLYRTFVFYAILVYPNSLVVGVPVMVGMYGPEAEAIQIFIVVLQTAVLLPLLVVLGEMCEATAGPSPSFIASEAEVKMSATRANSIVDVESGALPRNSIAYGKANDESTLPTAMSSAERKASISLLSRNGTPPKKRMLFVILRRLASNPMLYAAVAGIIYSCVAYKVNPNHHVPDMLNNTMQQFGTIVGGLALFNLGYFMHGRPLLPGKGDRIPLFLSLTARLVVSPVLMGLVAYFLNLRGLSWRVLTIQSALPQAIVTFSLALHYKIASGLLGSSVTLGTILSLPVMVAFYMILESSPDFLAN